MVSRLQMLRYHGLHIPPLNVSPSFPSQCSTPQPAPSVCQEPGLSLSFPSSLRLAAEMVAQGQSREAGEEPVKCSPYEWTHLTIIGINTETSLPGTSPAQMNLGCRGLGWNALKASHKSLPKMTMHKLIALEAHNVSLCTLPVSSRLLGMGPGRGGRELAKSP